MAQLKVRYTQRRRVLSVREKVDRVYVSGIGKDAEFKDISVGWVVTVSPGYDSFYVGTEKPIFKSGDHVNLILEGTVDAAAPSPNQDNNNKDAPNR